MKLIEKIWYQNHPLKYLLIPFSFLFRLLVVCRKTFYALKKSHSVKHPVPIIVVGNITVGGSGKTPLVIWLDEYLKELGFNPGIVSRGYGGKSTYPKIVKMTDSASETGDEPLMIARRTGSPVVISPDRNQAVRLLLESHPCNIIISDDGLQHYRMRRDIEIAVIDGERQFGNGHLLPAGPLREPISRLRQVDITISNGESNAAEHTMTMQTNAFIHLKTGKTKARNTAFQEQQIHAVAGIGNPDRFYKTLRSLGLNVIEHSFPDHHPYTPSDFKNLNGIILMTEKDAIKCESFCDERFWYLPVTAVLSKGVKYKLAAFL